MFEYNTLYAILLAVGLVAVIGFLLPYLRKKGINTNIYKDIKAGLLIFGYAFREDKIKAITTLLYGIVENIERMDLTPEEKKEIAFREGFNNIVKKFNIELSEDALNLIIDIAVSYLPATHKVAK